MGSQARFGRIRSWVLKENPRGTVPNTGTATGVATTATGRAPLGPGAAPGKPGEARQGATANGREDGTGRRGIRADVIVTPLPAARSRPEVLRATPGGDGNRDGRSPPARTGTAGRGFPTTPGTDDVTPGTSDAIPGTSDAIPGMDDVTPGMDGVTPETSGVTPETDDVTPGTDDVIPETDDAIPGTDDAIPEIGGAVPEEKPSVRKGNDMCRNRERPRRRTNPPHPRTLTSRCCQPACVQS